MILAHQIIFADNFWRITNIIYIKISLDNQMNYSDFPRYVRKKKEQILTPQVEFYKWTQTLSSVSTEMMKLY